MYVRSGITFVFPFFVVLNQIKDPGNLQFNNWLSINTCMCLYETDGSKTLTQPVDYQAK